MAGQQDPLARTIEKTLEQLRLRLKTSYQLPSNEPTEEQLFAIISELVGVLEEKGQVTDDHFAAVIERICPHGVRFVYQGMGTDLTEINGLLGVFQKEVKRSQSDA